MADYAHLDFGGGRYPPILKGGNGGCSAAKSFAVGLGVLALLAIAGGVLYVVISSALNKKTVPSTPVVSTPPAYRPAVHTPPRPQARAPQRYQAPPQPPRRVQFQQPQQQQQQQPPKRMDINREPVYYNVPAPMPYLPPTGYPMKKVAPVPSYIPVPAPPRQPMQVMPLQQPPAPRLLTSTQAATLPAPMPVMQMSKIPSERFEDTVDQGLQFMSNSNGSMASSSFGTQNGVASESPFEEAMYDQDPLTMTQETATDTQGIEQYLPDEGGITDKGIDPQTGLPVFTTSRLLRANQLDARGTGGYLQQVQDSLSGYRKVIGNTTGLTNFVNIDRDLARRREQFNAARAECSEPVLFNESDFQYF